MRIADELRAAASRVTEYPIGRKPDPEPTRMVVFGRCEGPSTTAPDVTQQIGTIEPGEVIEGEDDPNREPLNAQTDRSTTRESRSHCAGSPRPKSSTHQAGSSAAARSRSSRIW